MSLPEVATIGIAIVVPEPWASEILEWRMGFGDPYSDRMPTHITLLPPTKVLRSRIAPLLTELAVAVKSESAFVVTLGPVDTFRPVSPVVFLHARDADGSIARLEELVRPLFTAESRMHPFVPHVTVTMNVGDGLLDAAADALADFTASWLVTDIVVFERDARGYWSAVNSCELM